MMICAMLSIAKNTLRYKLFGTRTPVIVSISVTSRCNLKCVYCYSEEDNRRAADVPRQELFGIIDEFYALGTRVILLQGGEPLLHPDIDEIIAYVKSRGMYCALTTNSLSLEAHVAALKKLDQVQLSIDGDKEITEANRGTGVYASLLEAVKLCYENGIPFHLHTVLTKRTTVENTLEPLSKLAETYRTYVNFCVPAATGSARDRHLATSEQVHELYTTILDRKKQGMPTNNTEQGLLEVIAWTADHALDGYVRVDDPLRSGYEKCIMGNLVCWLDSAGMLHPCAVRFGQAGYSTSIREYGVQGAWERLKDLPCHYCAGSTEFNNLLRLSPSAVINSLKFLIRRPARCGRNPE